MLKSYAGHRRVVVAMSGGVDSSVAAALLKDQGCDVIGVTMRIWDDDQVWSRGRESGVGGQERKVCPPKGSVGGRGCCGMSAIDDARRVAHQLGIPHYTCDFRPDFQNLVVDDFCAEYARGRTPNPCIRCNRFLKFDILLRKARDLAADFVATGHYAKVEASSLKLQASSRQSQPHPPGRVRLLRSADPTKDQTYFLYSLTQDQLRHTMFPLGNMTKKEVRETARKLGLTTADKKESQEVCFAPKGSYVDFLKARFPELHRPGPILDLSGKIIGEHPGIIHFTVGQRRRIGIAARNPLYVVAIDPIRNSITVGSQQDAYGIEMKVGSLNWISVPAITSSMRAQVQIRHQHQAAAAEVTPLDRQTVMVRFDVPQWAITPGQAAVFCDGDTVVGGGIIDGPA